MNVSTPVDTRNCGRVSEIFNRVGDKWSMQVVVVLRGQPRRFNDLRRQINGISQQMLTRTLKVLERDGLVERTVRNTSPPQVDYALTTFGRSLAEPVRALAQWALANLDTLYDNRLRYDTNNDANNEANDGVNNEANDAVNNEVNNEVNDDATST